MKKAPKIKGYKGSNIKGYAHGGQTMDLAALLSQYAGNAGGGGMTNATSAPSAASAFANGGGGMGAVTQGAGLASNLIDKQAKDEYGYKNTNAGIASGALSYGAQGASLGSMVLPGWGTAIGAGVGLIGGGILGAQQAKKDQKNRADSEAELQRQKEEAEKNYMMPYKQFNLANSLYSRNLENYADGGPVKGKEPFVVNDPNDPRLRAYKDSLILYNQGVNNKKAFDAAKYMEDWSSGKNSYISTHPATKEEREAKNRLGAKPIIVKKMMTSEKFPEMGVSEAGVYMYKKPVVPVVYKPKEEVMYLEPKRMLEQSEPELRPMNNERINLEPETTTQIEATPYYQIKHTKDKTGKVIGTEYFDFNGKKLNEIKENYADGGKIVGPGTGKSDSIFAKVAENSHVIPVENAGIANEIRKKILKAPTTKKANLNQPGGVDVKLSNGEVIFSPEEKAIVESELGEGVLDALSPDADDKDEYLSGKRQMAKGGAMNSYGDGGNVKPKIDPDKLRAENKAERFKIRDNAIKEYRELKSKAERPGATEVDKYTYRKKLPELEKLISSINKDYGITPKTEASSSQTTKGASKAPMSRNVSKNVQKQPKTEILPTPEPNGLTVERMRGITPYGIDNKTVSPLASGVVPEQNLATMAQGTPIQTTGVGTPTFGEDVPTTNTDKARKGFNWGQAGDIASTALNYGIPLAQSIMGYNYLKNAGPRPVDTLDPDYLDSINKANQATTLAQKNAQFGFSPEEMALLKQRNKQLTDQGVFAARNYSGGSAANALVNTRGALGDAYGRDLQTQVQNRNLMLQKQDIANERQRYANDLIARKSEMGRRLFNDSMTAFNQNQQSGADLLSAGLSNLVAANRYEQEKRAVDKRAQMANSWMGTV